MCSKCLIWKLLFSKELMFTKTPPSIITCTSGEPFVERDGEDTHQWSTILTHDLHTWTTTSLDLELSTLALQVTPTGMKLRSLTLPKEKILKTLQVHGQDTRILLELTQPVLSKTEWYSFNQALSHWWLPSRACWSSCRFTSTLPTKLRSRWPSREPSDCCCGSCLNVSFLPLLVCYWLVLF